MAIFNSYVSLPEGTLTHGSSWQIRHRAAQALRRCASEGYRCVRALRRNSGSFTWILTVPCFQKSGFCDGDGDIFAEAGSRDRGWKVNYE